MARSACKLTELRLSRNWESRVTSFEHWSWGPERMEHHTGRHLVLATNLPHHCFNLHLSLSSLPTMMVAFTSCGPEHPEGVASGAIPRPPFCQDLALVHLCPALSSRLCVFRDSVSIYHGFKPMIMEKDLLPWGHPSSTPRGRHSW